MKQELVTDTSVSVRTLPKNVKSEDEGHFNLNQAYCCPALFVYRFEFVSFLPDATVFVWGFWPLKLSFPFYKRRLKLHNVKGILAIKSRWKRHILPRVPGGYFIVHDGWTANYYHWLTQALPRLLMFRKIHQDALLLIPDTHNHPFHVESLTILGEDRWQTMPTGKVYFQVHDLGYPSHDIQIGDYNEDIMRELSRRMRSSVPPSDGAALRLFINRRGATRRILNEDAVHEILRSFNFEILSFEDMTLSQQIAIASRAEVLAGVHGAGLTNMLFMQPGSKVLELTAIVNGEQYYFYTLSNALGHQYYYQQCIPDDAAKSLQDADITVDLTELSNSLKAMLHQS